MFCSAAAGIMNARRFSYLLAWARTDMDPDKWVIFAYEGMTAYQDPALPAPYIQSLCSPPPPLDIVEKVLSRLKVTIKADILCPEIQRRIDNRNEAEALSH